MVVGGRHGGDMMVVTKKVGGRASLPSLFRSLADTRWRCHYCRGVSQSVCQSQSFLSTCLIPLPHRTQSLQPPSMFGKQAGGWGCCSGGFSSPPTCRPSSIQTFAVGTVDAWFPHPLFWLLHRRCTIRWYLSMRWWRIRCTDHDHRPSTTLEPRFQQIVADEHHSLWLAEAAMLPPG